MLSSVPRSQRRFMLIAGLITALGPLSIDLYLPSLPAIQREFGATQAEVQATMATYLVGLAFGQLFYGPSSDAFGRKRPLLIGLLLYGLAVIACALSTSAAMLTWCRLLQALGGCAGGVVVRAMIRDRFESQEVARALSTLSLIMGAAPIVAPLIGGWLHTQFGWRSTFWVLAAFAALAAWVLWFKVEETRPDAPGRLALDSLWRNYGRMLRHRRFMGYAVAGAVAQAGLFAYISCGAFVFTQVYGVAEAQLGWHFAIVGLSYIAGSQINRQLLHRYRAEVLMRAALRAYLLSTSLMVLALLSGWASLPVFMALLACTTGSMGFSFPNSTAVALAPFGDRAGMAASLMGTMQFVLAGIMSWGLGHLASTSALPMALAMLGCAITAQAALRGLVKRPMQPVPARRLP
jgi:DHA1 family bicyclomycin/chloramphenicol resistance-like MFS transporter